MPRLYTPPAVLVSRQEACRRLGISERSFDRHWANVFTDPRDAGKRRERVRRRVFEDELETAVRYGGGERARIAVLNYKGRIGRKEIA